MRLDEFGGVLASSSLADLWPTSNPRVASVVKAQLFDSPLQSAPNGIFYCLFKISIVSFYPRRVARVQSR